MRRAIAGLRRAKRTPAADVFNCLVRVATERPALTGFGIGTFILAGAELAVEFPLLV